MKNIGKCRKKTIQFIGINAIIFISVSAVAIYNGMLERTKPVSIEQILVIAAGLITLIFILCSADNLIVFNKFQKRHRAS